jgi:hypothetical protein
MKGSFIIRLSLVMNTDEEFSVLRCMTPFSENKEVSIAPESITMKERWRRKMLRRDHNLRLTIRNMELIAITAQSIFIHIAP